MIGRPAPALTTSWPPSATAAGDLLVIIVDASAVVEALIGRDPTRSSSMASLATSPRRTCSTWRSFRCCADSALVGKLDPQAANGARVDYFALTIHRHEVSPLAERVWALRHRHTAYDACYLALAEALQAPLYTCDHKLDGDGHRSDVRVFPRTQ